MNKSQIFRYISLLVLLLPLLLWQGCKECDDPTDPECPNYCVDETNPQCPNYDPCTAQTPVSADFRIIENGSWGQIQLFDTVYYDTVWTGDLITEAISVHPDWKYTWYIGAGYYEGANTSLNYRSAPENTPIPITLVVEGPPNTACFPDGDGRDTVTRSVVFLPEWPYLGSYHGFLNGNQADTITIAIFRDLYRDVWLSNFKRGCQSQMRSRASTTTRVRFSWDGGLDCDGPDGLIIRDPEKTGDFDQVRMEYSLLDRSVPGTSTRIDYIFEGRKQ